jgi:hypothetical protein
MDFATNLSVSSMTKIILFSLIQIVCATAGFAQSPPWKANGEAIPARPDLNIRWQDSTKFPRKVWVYDVSPNKFSPEVISNVMTLCSFTENDKIEDNTSGMTFKNADSSRTLSISFSSGEIQYETPELHYSPTNLAVGVPSTNQLSEMAKNILSKLHISFSDITGWLGTNKIDFSEPLTMYFVGDATITNIPYRTVYFRRSVDGMPIAGHFYRFNVGEHGKISKISIAWPNLKPVKSYSMASRKDVINFLRSGNAIRGPVPTSVGDIDWLSIKGVTIKKAVPSYQISNNQLYPFLRLDALVDTGNGTVDIGMDCPIIDETKM